jgi:hypothetical protein
VPADRPARSTTDIDSPIAQARSWLPATAGGTGLRRSRRLAKCAAVSDRTPDAAATVARVGTHEQAGSSLERRDGGSGRRFVACSRQSSLWPLPER